MVTQPQYETAEIRIRNLFDKIVTGYKEFEERHAEDSDTVKRIKKEREEVYRRSIVIRDALLYDLAWSPELYTHETFSKLLDDSVQQLHSFINSLSLIKK